MPQTGKNRCSSWFNWIAEATRARATWAYGPCKKSLSPPGRKKEREEEKSRKEKEREKRREKSSKEKVASFLPEIWSTSSESVTLSAQHYPHRFDLTSALSALECRLFILLGKQKKRKEQTRKKRKELEERQANTWPKWKERKKQKETLERTQDTRENQSMNFSHHLFQFDHAIRVQERNNTSTSWFQPFYIAGSDVTLIRGRELWQKQKKRRRNEMKLW